jgi:hypothetical protein
VSAGRYFIGVSLLAGNYVKSVRFGGADITRKPLDFAGGSAELDILVAKGTGQLSGTVANGRAEPVQGATVSLWPVTPDLSKPNRGVLSATSSQNGTFALTNTPPGEYYLVAFEELPEPGIGQYPDFVERFTSDAVRVKLDVNGSASATPKLVTRDQAARIAARSGASRRRSLRYGRRSQEAPAADPQRCGGCRAGMKLKTR